MEKCGLVRPSADGTGNTVYSFADLGLLRQTDAEMATGVPFRRVLRALMATRDGQLAFDFRLDAPPAKVLRLTRPDPPPLMALMGAVEQPPDISAEQYFHAASVLDDGTTEHTEDAMNAYRRALEVDPYMVPALINLANLHYYATMPSKRRRSMNAPSRSNRTCSKPTSTWATSSTTSAVTPRRKAATARPSG